MARGSIEQPSIQGRCVRAAGVVAAAALACAQQEPVEIPDWLLPRVGVCATLLGLPELPQPMTAQRFADLDDDGTDELVAAGGTFFAITTLTDTTAPFVTHLWTISGADLTWVATGDVNGDGLPDAAALDLSAQPPNLWLSVQTESGFSPPRPIAIARSETVVLVDVDADARADLVGVDANEGRIWWARSIDDGEGLPTFDTRQYGGDVCQSTGCTHVTLAAFDSDGDDLPEVWVGDADANATAVSRFSLTEGTLGEPAAIATAQGLAGRLLVVDVDADARMDLLTWAPGPNGRHDEIAVRLGQEAGGFGEATRIVVGDLDLVRRNTLRSVAAADIDGDGLADLWLDGQLVAGDGQGGFEFVGHIDHGDAFIDHVSDPVGPCSFEASAIGDFDHDGLFDIAACRWYASGSSSSALYYNGWWSSLSYVVYEPAPTLVAGCVNE